LEGCGYPVAVLGRQVSPLEDLAKQGFGLGPFPQLSVNLSQQQISVNKAGPLGQEVL
jgi:hypothetical protein